MNIAARRRNTFSELEEPGDFVYTGRRGMEGHQGLIFLCPCGCGDSGHITFDTVPLEPNNDQRWKWDGNEEQPTLSPSLKRDGGCGWHGWLQRGVFKE